MQTMSISQRESLANVLEEMENLLEMIKSDRFEFGLSWRDDEKLLVIKQRASQIVFKIGELA